MTLEQLLSPGWLAGLCTPAAVTTMAGLAAFIVVAVVWRTLLQSDPLAVRAQRLREQRHGRPARRAAPLRLSHRQQATSLMRRIARRLNLLRDRTTAHTAEQLACAGWRSPDALVVFMVAKLCAPFLGGAAALLMIHGLNMLPEGHPLRPFVPILATGLGFYAPELFVRNAVGKRQKAIQKGLPDALDLLIICVEAGLSLDAALTRVAAEIGPACPPLADELGLTAVELGFLPDRRQALQNLAKRCPSPSIRAVVTTLVQTERYGTPLAKSLRVLSEEFRNDRIMKAEEKAARLPAILTVPMIVFIMPALFIVLAGPAALRVVDALKHM